MYVRSQPAQVDDGEVIVFVSTKVAAEELGKNLVKFNFRAASLHGDKQQVGNRLHINIYMCVIDDTNVCVY